MDEGVSDRIVRLESGEELKVKQSGEIAEIESLDRELLRLREFIGDHTLESRQSALRLGYFPTAPLLRSQPQKYAMVDILGCEGKMLLCRALKPQFLIYYPSAYCFSDQ